MGKDCTTKLKWNIITQILSLIFAIISYFWKNDKWWFKALYIEQLISVTIANIVLLTCCKKKKKIQIKRLINQMLKKKEKTFYNQLIMRS